MNDQAARTAEQVTYDGALRAGSAVQRAGEAVQRAGAAVERHGTIAAPAVGAAIGDTLHRAGAAVGETFDRAADLASAVGETVTGVLDEPAVRGGAAVAALRGRGPAPVRRWPWALAAAAAGAAAGAAVVLVRRRIEGQDAPDAQEPHELQAVVDLPTEPAPPAGPPPTV